MAVVVDAPRRARAPGRRIDERVALAGWVGLVLAGVAWGTLQIDGVYVGLRAAPFFGRWGWHGGVGLVPAIVFGAAAVAWGGMLAARLPWRFVPLVAGAGATVWTAALAAGDGWSRLTEPLTSRHEYEPLAGRVDDLGGFLSSYVDRLTEYPIHVQGHPPGPVVLAWGLDRIGFGGAGWLAGVVLVGWGVAVAAVLVAARVVAGEATARRAAPVLVLLPAAVWAGTSLDGLFAGVIAVGIALAAVGAARGSAAYVLGSGVVLGVALLSTYGATPLLLVPVVLLVLLADRPVYLVGLLAVGVLLPLGSAALAGFWWFDGLAATRDAYWSGLASVRPAAYLTFLGNPAVLAVAVGPAVAVGLAYVGVRTARSGRSWRQSRQWVLPMAALLAVVAADLSQYSLGEVERIWLPFMPWLALAGPGDRRVWLAAQVGVAVLLQSVLVSRW